jgi:hypothetical protein
LEVRRISPYTLIYSKNKKIKKWTPNLVLKVLILSIGTQFIINKYKNRGKFYLHSLIHPLMARIYESIIHWCTLDKEINTSIFLPYVLMK